MRLQVFKAHCFPPARATPTAGMVSVSVVNIYVFPCPRYHHALVCVSTLVRRGPILYTIVALSEATAGTSLNFTTGCSSSCGRLGWQWVPLCEDCVNPVRRSYSGLGNHWRRREQQQPPGGAKCNMRESWDSRWLLPGKGEEYYDNELCNF